MFCSKCGAPLNGATFCSACGNSVVVTPNVTSAPTATPTYGTVPQAPSANPLAIAGFVLSLVGFGYLNWLGVVFGIIALNQIKKSNGTQSGRGLAIAGIVIGGFGVVLVALFVIGITMASMSSTGYY